MITNLQVLRAKIRGLQAEGASIHARIRKAHGPKRNKLWNEKRALGNHCREHLIAYGLLRNVPYEKIERCAKQNRPNVVRVFELMKAHGDWKLLLELTVNQVEGFLRPQTAPEKSS